MKRLAAVLLVLAAANPGFSWGWHHATAVAVYPAPAATYATPVSYSLVHAYVVSAAAPAAYAPLTAAYGYAYIPAATVSYVPAATYAAVAVNPADVQLQARIAAVGQALTPAPSPPPAPLTNQQLTDRLCDVTKVLEGLTSTVQGHDRAIKHLQTPKQ